jgi:hypothetical protein
MVYLPYVFGLDLAETTDYTAGCSIKVLEEQAPNGKPILLLGDLFRFRLGTGLGEIADEVARMVADERFMTHRRVALDPSEVHFDQHGLVVKHKIRRSPPQVLVDITGIGWGVRELLRERGVRYEAVRFRPNSETYHYDPSTRTHNVPKQDLIAAILIAWIGGELQTAPGLEMWPVLREELVKLRRKQNPRTGYTTVEHWRERDHDDLVFSVAMPIWWYAFRQRRRPKPQAIAANFPWAPASPSSPPQYLGGEGTGAARRTPYAAPSEATFQERDLFGLPPN